ncbi:MAG: dehydrogenase [Bdellovibrionaceae bacterium]|nr:dehydrogenase [Pseudobdellovibrionaceae bacterium]
MKPLYRIANLSFGTSRWDFTYTFEFREKRFEVQRFGADYDIDILRSMITRNRHQVDAFAMSSLPTEIRFKDKTYIHRQTLEIMSTPSSVPLCHGASLRDLANIDGLARLTQEGRIRPELGVFFPNALLNMECVNFLKENHRQHLFFGDAYILAGIPAIATPDSFLAILTKAGLNLANLFDLASLAPRGRGRLSRMVRSALLSQTRNIQYVLADPAMLTLYNEDLDFLVGKDVIVPSCLPAMEDEIRKHGAKSIIHLMPPVFRQLSPHISHPVIDATLRLALEKAAPLSLEEWQEILNAQYTVTQQTRRFVLGARPSTQARLTTGVRKLGRRMRAEATPDFAFVVHSLSYQHIFKAPGLRLLPSLPPEWSGGFEKAISQLPGFVYGRAEKIISKKTGREVRGIIYALTATPRIMREEPPEVTYKKIEQLCYDAAERGAKIMGLGAYTKVVGDAGATINRNSPIPVTTGNSLSASATLWAAHDVVRRMGLVHFDLRTQRVAGVAAVIGATGSIGKVSAKLLAMAFQKLVLIAPRMERLQELADDIQKLEPQCQVIISTDANSVAKECDLLVTATSAFDQKIVDIEKIKPGCVVCDCSRPLDFTTEDAMKRPDILIIESGEVILPGPQPQLNCDLGLPDHSVYACLGETAVLAMEGLYEPFTLGRDIEWEKVKRIYKLAREHGVDLAAIRGHAGIVTDREIQLTRELALKRRSQQSS